MRHYFLFVLSLAIALPVWSQVLPLPGSYSQNIQSSLCYPDGNPLGNPLFELGTTSGLIFEFDELSTEQKDYSYAVILCTYDWQKEALPTSDYIQGFASNGITDINGSFNTLIEFNHYRFTFPNDMMKLRLSGNYMIVVYEGDDPEDSSQWRVGYRMVAYESLVQIRSNVSGSSVVADRFRNQEVDFVVRHDNYSIYDFQNELHVGILQNMNWSTLNTSLHPIFINNNQLTYDFNSGENTFGGGAEYRNFEFKSLQYQSSAVDHLEKHDDGYHLFLRTDQATGQRAQSSGNDLNGSFYIMNDDAEDRNLEGEYVQIHFSLALKEQKDTRVYLDGQYFRTLSALPELQYNETTNRYEVTVLIKQGFIDYRYITEDLYSAIRSCSITEGQSSGTENNYHIIVYNRDRSTGHDRIIGLTADNSVR
jgi:hypothetical protein